MRHDSAGRVLGVSTEADSGSARARASNIRDLGGVRLTAHSPAFVTSLRSVLASTLLAVLAVGGVALPTAHRAWHGVETAAERTEHVETAHHSSDGDQAQTPCAPKAHDVDCAICAGFSAAPDLALASVPAPGDPEEATTAYADWVRTTTAAGAGARAPPAS